MSISVRRDSTTGTRHTVRIRNEAFATDVTQPDGQGAATPHDLYDASLAACKALTVMLYAQRKNMPIEDIEVLVDRDDSAERKGIYRLKTSLRVTGALDETQRAELLRVAAKCPVHKLMTEVTTEIETGWA